MTRSPDPSTNQDPRPGDKVLHRFNRELGPGEVVEVTEGRMRVHFPGPEEILEFSLRENPFTPLVLPEGTDPERWFESFHEDLVERLARLETDKSRAWENRLDSLRLGRIREADGLGSFLGGRIEIFPHQLHVAEQATARDPVRWLLADEVGLGKTVEACLILSRLLRQRRAERVLIVSPASLTVQWLGELYRKFHQVFVLLDEERRRDARKDFGDDLSPFEVHPRSVLSLEDLVEDPELARKAQAAEFDLLVVDEAHRLERRPGHPGSPAYRTIAPLCARSRHVLLLTATPLEADAHGFFRLLELLRPDEYHSWDEFREGLLQGIPLEPCTSSTTRDDIGGLPPRTPLPVNLPTEPEILEKEKALSGERPENPLQERRLAERIQALWAQPYLPDDPRIDWILHHEPDWHEARDKMLLFVRNREALDLLKKELERKTFRRVGVFHEDLTPAARDLEVAQFAAKEGPTLLISTEAGGEGRNFEFCRGIVLFDLPWDPVLLEQRIGRLDRINRKQPVRIHYFVPERGFAREVAQLYEALGIFREPLGGLDRSLGHVQESIRTAAAAPSPRLDVPTVVRETREARALVNRALYHDLHRNRYRPDRAEAILARIPEDLEERNARVVLAACRQFGFDTVAKPEPETYYLEFGAEAVVDHLPGVPEGSRWLGTFDREHAVTRETLDFFASGHPLVEAILMELEDGHRGETALLDVMTPDFSGGGGLLAVLGTGAEFEIRVMDFEGRIRPEWAAPFGEGSGTIRTGRPGDWGLTAAEAREAFAQRVRHILVPLQQEAKLLMAAAFRFIPGGD